MNRRALVIVFIGLVVLAGGVIIVNLARPQPEPPTAIAKNDSFNRALLELDTFEVDYLDKNLRVTPRKRKRYDFTDPQGNADRLFVFHRDVEKARERLKKGDPPGE